MVRLVVTDMDGTLLDDQKKLSPDFWDVERQLSEKGVLFAVASGRQFYNLYEVFEATRDRTIFLAENGSYGFYKGKELFVDPLDRGAAHDFIRIARTLPGTGMILCCQGAAYIESVDERFVAEVKKHYARIEIVPDLLEVHDTCLKFTVCDFSALLTRTYPRFSGFSDDFKVAVSGAIWLDITDRNANKGTAVKRIQEQFGISEAETMVFGDFLNDVEMMAVARYSYAMKNAHHEIVRIAQYVTEKDNNEAGVTDTIRRVVLA
jgi:Cof subfamily protein (haloacid dehalogenase superfamily)